MIEKLSIKGYKSIRELDLSCRRVNVFIGEPNTGKTNILEALGLWCIPALQNLSKVARVRHRSHLHFNNDLASPIQVGVRGSTLVLKGGNRYSTLYIDPEPRFNAADMRLEENLSWTDPYNDGDEDYNPWGFVSATSYFLFDSANDERRSEALELEPPFGSNLASLILSSSAARQAATAYFQNSGLILNVDASQSEVNVTRQLEGALLTLPYTAASETLRRMLFFGLALDTHHDQSLILDEPEAHAYPPYTKILAEKIALDSRGNQFFLTTHSPYMLTSLISKTPAADLNVVLCRMENFETKAYVMSEEQKVQLMDWGMSAFFNFDRLLPEEAS